MSAAIWIQLNFRELYWRKYSMYITSVYIVLPHIEWVRQCNIRSNWKSKARYVLIFNCTYKWVIFSTQGWLWSVFQRVPNINMFFVQLHFKITTWLNVLMTFLNVFNKLSTIWKIYKTKCKFKEEQHVPLKR